MLTEAQDFILEPEGSIRSKAAIYLYGKEVTPETYAVCKSDMMIKDNAPAVTAGMACREGKPG